jgi:hypothetical protein
MTSKSQPPHEAAAGQSAKSVHHGETPAAWTGAGLTLVAFILGAVGLLIHNWLMFWIAVALVVIALIATQVLRKTGHGAD